MYKRQLLKVPYKPRVISGMGVIILYTLMTGLGPSVIRAALMLLFVLIGKLIDRDSHSVALLSFVALLMLLYNPAYLNDVGFQLSFLVTFGTVSYTHLDVYKRQASCWRNWRYNKSFVNRKSGWRSYCWFWYFESSGFAKTRCEFCFLSYLRENKNRFDIAGEAGWGEI